MEESGGDFESGAKRCVRCDIEAGAQWNPSFKRDEAEMFQGLVDKVRAWMPVGTMQRKGRPGPVIAVLKGTPDRGRDDSEAMSYCGRTSFCKVYRIGGPSTHQGYVATVQVAASGCKMYAYTVMLDVCNHFLGLSLEEWAAMERIARRPLPNRGSRGTARSSTDVGYIFCCIVSRSAGRGTPRR